MVKYVGKYWFVSCLLVLIFSPMICGNYRKEVSEIENRNLAKMEPLFLVTNGKIIIHDDPVSMLSAWFDDHIGFREQSIRILASIRWNLFRIMDDQNYLTGKKENWFWIGSDHYVLERWQGFDPINEEGNLPVIGQLEEFNERLSAQGIPFIMALCPDKISVYTEELPETVNRIDTENRFERLVEIFRENSDIDIFYMRDMMVSHKDDGYRLYNIKHDTSHWNFRGAYYGYLEIMRHLQRYDSSLDIVEEDEILFYEEEVSGSVLYGAITYRERIPKWKVDRWHKVDRIFDEIDKLNTNNSHWVNPDLEYSGKKLLIVGDSYIHSFLNTLFAQSFRDVYFIHIGSEGILAQIERINPDFVVYEIPERGGISLNITK